MITLHSAMVAWVLGIMVSLQPPATTPWAVTYGRTADAFVTAAEREPLFKGPRGIERTVDYEISVAWFESNFKPGAKGDGGASLGEFQVAPGTAAPYLGQSRAKRAAYGDVFDPWRTVRDDLFDVDAAPGLALRLMKVSFGICRDRPLAERLGWYAAGGAGCRGVKESRNRVGKAEWLLRTHPFVAVSDDSRTALR